MKHWKLAGLILFLLAGCGAPVSDGTNPGHVPPNEGSARFASGGWNVGGFRRESGFPFDHEVVDVQIEIENVGDAPGEPVCYLAYGSQTARVEADEVFEPGVLTWVMGTAEFPRPLDDYESTDASCHTSEDHSAEREIARSYARLEPGRPTKVPDLIGEPAGSGLSSYPRGLIVQLRYNSTPCPDDKVERMLRSFGDPFRPQCAAPHVVAQSPEPRTKATVGDVILVDVAPRSG